MRPHKILPVFMLAFLMLPVCAFATWTDVEKSLGTTGDMTYSIAVLPPDAIPEECGYLRCVVNLTGVTMDEVIFNMSVNSLQIAEGRHVRAGGEEISVRYRCLNGIIIIFTLAFPDKPWDYGENNAWVFKQIV